MNAAMELIQELDAIGGRPEPWAAAARTHACRLRRLSNSPRSREDALNRLEGAEDVFFWASLLDAETHARLTHLLIEAWSVHYRGEWPVLDQGGVS